MYNCFVTSLFVFENQRVLLVSIAGQHRSGLIPLPFQMPVKCKSQGEMFQRRRQERGNEKSEQAAKSFI